MERHGGTATVRSAAVRAPRSSSRCRGATSVTDQPDVPAAAPETAAAPRVVGSCWSTTTGCSAAGCAPSSATRSRSSARPRTSSGAVPVIDGARAPDVVLLDVHLPGGGGRAVLSARAAAARRPLPRPVGVRRPGGRDRRDPRRRPRLRHQVDHRPGAGRRVRAGGRRRRRCSRRGWPASCSTRSPRPPTWPPSTRTSTGSPSREREVLRLIARGYTYKEVAKAAVHLGEDGRDARVGGAAQAAAVQPARAHPLGHRPPPRLSPTVG